MVLHSFKIPIRPIPLDSTVLGSSSGQALKFHLEGQPNLRFSNPAKPGKPSAIHLNQRTLKLKTGVGLRVMLKESSASFFLPQKYFKTRGVIGRRKTPWTGDTTNLGGPGQDKQPNTQR